MNIDLTEEDIVQLQQNTENNINTNNDTKRNLDGQMKDATEGHKRIIFPALDLSTKIIGLGNGSSEGIIFTYEIE